VSSHSRFYPILPLICRQFIAEGSGGRETAAIKYRALVGRDTARGPVPKTLHPIFRDREDFSGGHSLTDQERNRILLKPLDELNIARLSMDRKWVLDHGRKLALLACFQSEQDEADDASGSSRPLSPPASLGY
jgi:hypothetical protein